MCIHCDLKNFYQRFGGICMNINHIRYYLEVAEQKTISSAAKNLYTSESTINSGITKLEEELGYRLFYRSKKGMYLTEKGKLIRDQAVQILNHIEYWYSLADKDDISSSVHVIAPPIIRRMVLSGVLSTVFSQYDFSVEVYTENCKHILKIISENPDAIILEPCESKYMDALYDLCTANELFCECMYPDKGYLYYNGNLCLDQKISFREVQHLNVVGYSKNSMYGLFDEYYKHFSKTIVLPSSFEQWELIKTNTDVVGIFTNLISIYNREDFCQGKLYRSEINDQDLNVNWMMVYSKKNKDSKVHEIVLDLIRQEFSKIEKSI